MRGMTRTFRAVCMGAAFLVSALAVTGCSKKADPADPGELPPGTQLMAEGDKAMSDVKSAHFTLEVKGEIKALAVSHAEGDLTREGSAQGTAKAKQFGMVVELAFVIVGQDLYLKGPTGGYQKMPLATAASVYDPSAILDPERGAAKLLRTAKNPQTQAIEQVNGEDAYKISFEPDTAALTALVPTTLTGVTGLVWLDTDTKRIAKAEFKVPASGSDPEATIVVTFTNYDAPVTISAP